MPAPARRATALLGAVTAVALGCAGVATEPAVQAPPLEKLELQVRNSGMHGGYLWLGITGGAGRWHTFGEAEFLCVTCPVPFTGVGPSYEIAIFDEQCQLHAREHTKGGNLQVAIELGPLISLVPAPPILDWVPGDSPPADVAQVPCAAA
jgi:hypothetical protein